MARGGTWPLGTVMKLLWIAIYYGAVQQYMAGNSDDHGDAVKTRRPYQIDLISVSAFWI